MTTVGNVGDCPCGCVGCVFFALCLYAVFSLALLRASWGSQSERASIPTPRRSVRQRRVNKCNRDFAPTIRSHAGKSAHPRGWNDGAERWQDDASRVTAEKLERLVILSARLTTHVLPTQVIPALRLRGREQPETRDSVARYCSRHRNFLSHQR